MPNNQSLIDLQFLIESGFHEFMDDFPKKHYNRNINKNNTQKEPVDKLVLENINNLEDLRIFINNFEKCKLKKISKNTVFSDGNSNADIMLIGEAPGREEDIKGLPFVGVAGKLLDKMLAAIELDRSKVYITNIIPWRPPGNRQPTTEEIITCLPFVQRHIEIINPKILILLGSTASKALLMSDLGIMKLHGKWYKYISYGLEKPILTRAIFHPAFLLRTPSYKKLVWEDLLIIKKEIYK